MQAGEMDAGETERAAVAVITALAPHRDTLVEAAIAGMADLQCDLAAGDTFDPADYREDATAAVGAICEWLAWSGVVIAASPVGSVQGGCAVKGTE